MAEIHVQTKRHSTTSPMWIWIIVALLIVAVVAWFVLKNRETTPPQTPTPANPASQVQNINDANGIYVLS